MDIIIVDAVIINRNKLLLLKKFSKDYFEFPGGKVRKEEEVEDCLKREVNEEIGIKIIKFRKNLELKFNFENKNITDHIFVIAKYENQPKIKEKDVFEKLIWADKISLKQMKLAPNVKKFIKKNFNDIQ